MCENDDIDRYTCLVLDVYYTCNQCLLTIFEINKAIIIHCTVLNVYVLCNQSPGIILYYIVQWPLCNQHSWANYTTINRLLQSKSPSWRMFKHYESLLDYFYEHLINYEIEGCGNCMQLCKITSYYRKTECNWDNFKCMIMHVIDRLYSEQGSFRMVGHISLFS